MNLPHRHHRWLSALAIACLASVAQARDAAPVAVETASVDADLGRAMQAAQAFSTRLRERLQAGIEAGGAAQAVAVCHSDAPRIATEVMREHGVRLGRIAVPGRNRHPQQDARDWPRAAIERFQQAVDAGGAAAAQREVIREGLPADVAVRLVRGIATEAACLACHGTTLEPAVRAALARDYPADRATGFAVGDLRGALWVEVPVVPPPAPNGETR